VGGETHNLAGDSACRRIHCADRIAQEIYVTDSRTTIAVFPNHQAAERAVKKLIEAGFEMKNLSLVGKGYHSEEKVTGFYGMGDRVKFWGTRGAFWGGFWGLFFGGLFLTVPIIGHVVVLGYLAAVVAAGIENALVVGGLSALGAALYSLGVPKDSVLNYESDLKADGFLVMARGSEAEVERAKALLADLAPLRSDTHRPQFFPKEGSR
jgi:hypothetical protein